VSGASFIIGVFAIVSAIHGRRVAESSNRAALAAITSANATTAAVDQAREANVLVRQEMAIRLRPWVGIQPPIADRVEINGAAVQVRGPQEPTMNVGLDFLSAGGEVVYSFPLSNYGATPAQRLGIAVAQSFGESEVREQIHNEKGLDQTVLCPKQTLPQRLTVQGQTYLEYTAPSGRPYYVGCNVTYADQEGSAWETEAIFKMEGSLITIVSQIASEPIPATTEGQAES